ncbi:hypothetical protein KI387_021024, partial [Taxus chinensis]
MGGSSKGKKGISFQGSLDMGIYIMEKVGDIFLSISKGLVSEVKKKSEDLSLLNLEFRKLKASNIVLEQRMDILENKQDMSTSLETNKGEESLNTKKEGNSGAKNVAKKTLYHDKGFDIGIKA